MDMYRENILDHYKNPRGKGLLAAADGQAPKNGAISGQAEAYNQICGDRVTVQLDLQGGNVIAMRFDGHGCAISQACASLLSEDVVGKKQSELAELGLSDIEELIGFSLSPTRAKCALLPLQAAQSALTHGTPPGNPDYRPPRGNTIGQPGSNASLPH